VRAGVRAACSAIVAVTAVVIPEALSGAKAARLPSTNVKPPSGCRS
jgi:hypothetical protein